MAAKLLLVDPFFKSSLLKRFLKNREELPLKALSRLSRDKGDFLDIAVWFS